MIGIELGPQSPEAFEAGKLERVKEEDLDPGLLYYWLSLQSNGEASAYNSRIYNMVDHAPKGMLAVRFAILSPHFHEIRHSWSLFADGLYQGQRNGMPFIKREESGSTTTVDEGYFRGPIEIEDTSILVHNGTHGSPRPLQLSGYK